MNLNLLVAAIAEIAETDVERKDQVERRRRAMAMIKTEEEVEGM